jgi:virginiamycin B lyase
MSHVDVERELWALREQTLRREPSPDAWPRLQRRLRREPWRQVVLAAVVALAIAAVAVAPGAVTRWTKGTRTVGPAPGTVTSTTSLLSPRLMVVARIKLPRGVVDVASGEGAVWVAGFGQLARIDPRSNRVVVTIPTLGSDEGARLAIAAGSVWATSGSTTRGAVYRIDPVTNRVTATIPMPGGAFGIAAANGLLWVTQPREGTGVVLRIDPRHNRVVGPPIPVGSEPGPITSGLGALWVTNTDGGGSVTRIDPASGATTPADHLSGAAAIGAGSLWSLGDPEVSRIDPGTARTLAIIRIPDAGVAAFGAGALWVMAHPPSSSVTLYLPIPGKPGLLYRIDPATNRIVGSPVPIRGIQPIAIAVSQDAVWVGDFDSQTVTRVALLG